jgi:HemK-related putative methylase
LSGVYEPSDDSLFLSNVIAGVQADRVAEVGVGSGFVIDGYIQANTPEVAVGTDVDIEAIKVARGRGGHDSIEYVLCRSCDAFRKNAFQLVFFNPPYLKEEAAEDATTSGGEGGVARTHEMACSSYMALATKGFMIFLASSLSDVESLLSQLHKEGMRPRKLASSKLFFEELYAFKVTKESLNRKSR